MTTLMRATLVTALLTTAGSPALAGDLRLTIANGRATIVAKNVSLREILAEWARVGQTRIVNAEKLSATPVTLELTNVPEAQALDTLLRSAAGYVMAPRAAAVPGASTYDRIMILASSRPPVTASGPAAYSPRQIPMPQPQMQMQMQMPPSMTAPPDDDVDPTLPPSPNLNAPGAPSGPVYLSQPVLQAPINQAPTSRPSMPTATPSMPQAMPPGVPNPYQAVPASQYPTVPGGVPSPTTAPPAPAARPGIPSGGRGGG